jgi:hypothetical protein
LGQTQSGGLGDLHIIQQAEFNEMTGCLAGRFLAAFLQPDLLALLTSLLASLFARLQQQGGLIVQGFFACFGPVAGFFIGAQGAQFFDRPLDRG